MTNVLVYRLGSLGDTIVALPALRAVAKAFPDSKRTMLTNFSVSSKAAPIAEILQNTGLIDQYIEYPLNLRNPMALLALRNRIRSLGSDVLVYLAAPRGLFKAYRDAVFFRSCGIKRIIGIPLAADQQTCQPLSNEMFEFEGNRLLRCIKSLEEQGSDVSDAFNLALTETEASAASTLLAPLGNSPIIAISIGAKADVKDWGQDNWLKLMPELAWQFPGHSLVMLGAPIERDRSDELGSLWPGKIVNLCGMISVRSSAAVLARSDIYLGHDSGPMHLAAAVGTPCVAIFSSQNLPGEWFPQGARHRILYKDIECRGCRLTICEERKKACIRSISVADVAAAAADILSMRVST